VAPSVQKIPSWEGWRVAPGWVFPGRNTETKPSSYTPLPENLVILSRVAR